MTIENSAPIRVFLIDDHRSILWGLERLIDSGKPVMQVVGSAASCTEALKFLDDASPNLILLDIDLGKESGVDEIPRLLARSRAKILVLTGLRDQSVHDKAVLAGARGVVQKEAAAETILSAIAKVHAGQIWLDRAATSRIFVEFSRESAAQATVLFRNFDIDLDRCHDVNSGQDLLTLVEANFGIAMAPRSMRGPDTVKRLPVEGIDLSRTVYLYGVAGRQRTAVASAMLKMLRARDWSVYGDG